MDVGGATTGASSTTPGKDITGEGIDDKSTSGSSISLGSAIKTLAI
jgi:hypothetical protein